jgi:hypothetical protein
MNNKFLYKITFEDHTSVEVWKDYSNCNIKDFQPDYDKDIVEVDVIGELYN